MGSFESLSAYNKQERAAHPEGEKNFILTGRAANICTACLVCRTLPQIMIAIMIFRGRQQRSVISYLNYLITKALLPGNK